MEISVIGTGYVGLVTACFANFGHNLLFVDIDSSKIEKINNKTSPIFEPGLEEILVKNMELGRIKAYTNYKPVRNTDVIFICVGTPSKKDGSINLSNIKKASSMIGKQIKKSDRYIVVVVKSTVVPGTTEKVVKPILEKSSGKKCGQDFGLCMNPEFLKEGTAVHDFIHADKIVIGSYDDKSFHCLEKLYENFDSSIPRLKYSLATAEMIKYAQNAMLASRISFINEIANICERFKVDIYDVAHAVGLDKRIGPKFLQAGIGFGGSCFPKDVKALIATAKSVGVKPAFLKSIIKINELQPNRMIELAKKTIGNLNNKTVAVLGIAFKPDTDDIRESRAVPIINMLTQLGSRVKIYDPKAMDNAKKFFGDKVEYCEKKEDCILNADLCMFATDWKEFKDMDISIIKCPIIDGRRAINPENAKSLGVTYRGIGWSDNYDS